MIKARFYKRGRLYTGFETSGHAESGDPGFDTVCAAVSSAYLMAINTITDVICLKAGIKSDKGYLILNIKDDPAPAQDTIKGLLIHMQGLETEYPDKIEVKISEE